MVMVRIFKNVIRNNAKYYEGYSESMSYKVSKVFDNGDILVIGPTGTERQVDAGHYVLVP